MKAASIFSRRKICSKMRLTEVVPAPEEPVIEMMGCLADMRLSPSSRPEEAAIAEQRRTLADRARSGMVARDAFDFLRRSEDERRALVQVLGLDFKNSNDGVGGCTACMLD